MRRPPSSTGHGVLNYVEQNRIPNFAFVRLGAQAVHAAAIHDLHRGDLAAALENLEALSAFVWLHEEETLLVSYLLRVATVALSVDAYWDALQAPGWSEAQLARMQQQVAPARRLLGQLPRVRQADRAERLYLWDLFRSQSYEAWLDRHETLFRPYGMTLPSWRTNTPVRQWHQWVFHPLWAFAWADQEKLDYLRFSRLEQEALEDAVESAAYRKWNDRATAIERDCAPPVLRWRFYEVLPFREEAGSASCRQERSARPAHRQVAYPNAWKATFKNLTMCELASTAIALKRYELRQGSLPPSLEALVPDYLPSVPRDLMDGQPLRYLLNREGTFTLYSVGEDLRDDGGDPGSDRPTDRGTDAPWTGRDWVWPRAR